MKRFAVTFSVNLTVENIVRKTFRSKTQKLITPYTFSFYHVCNDESEINVDRYKEDMKRHCNRLIDDSKNYIQINENVYSKLLEWDSIEFIGITLDKDFDNEYYTMIELLQCLSYKDLVKVLNSYSKKEKK